MSVFTIGGISYGLLELAFRGRTHWSMLIAGGLSCVFLYIIAAKSREPMWKKCIMGGAVITTVEFLTGIAVNILLGWNVWSYASRPVNLMGQICPLFSLMWTILSAPVLGICAGLSGRLERR